MDTIELNPGVSVSVRSKFVPVEIGSSSNAPVVIATVGDAVLPANAGAVPTQFIMLIGSRFTRVSVKVVGLDVVFDPSPDKLQDLIDIVSGESDTASRSSLKERCRDLVVKYELYGRPKGGKWVNYAHGPLTLLCALPSTPFGLDDADPSTGHGSEGSPATTPGTPAPSGSQPGGEFDGGDFAGTFD